MAIGAFSEVVRASVDLKSRASVEMMARRDPTIRASQQRMRDIATGASANPGAPTPVPEAIQAEKREKERVNITASVKAADVVVHTYSTEEITNMLKTNLVRGLTAAEGREKLARDGPNVLTPPPETPWYVKLAMQMVGGFQVMMIVGAILCFIVGPISEPIDWQTIYLGIVLVIVVVSTGFFAWWQERKSDSVMAGFKALTPARCNVVRDGQVIEMDAKELVAGDICMVNFGEKARCVHWLRCGLFVTLFHRYQLTAAFSRPSTSRSSPPKCESSTSHRSYALRLTTAPSLVNLNLCVVFLR
jgi:cation transport ATPase